MAEREDLPVVKTYVMLIAELDQARATYRITNGPNAALELRLPRTEWISLGNPSWIRVEVTDDNPTPTPVASATDTTGAGA